MTSLSFAECCRLLAIDPKTLRQWLTQAQMTFHTDPANAKIKCLEMVQVQTLACQHGRVLQFSASVTTFEAQRQMLSTTLSDPGLQARLTQMEAQVATLQAQLTELALQLLREREEHMEQRLLALEAGLASPDAALPVVGQVAPPAFVCHATEKRNRLIPLIEYGARGRYILICPEQGELAIIPDSPEWYAWLASLTSFRFVGQAGRFSARRGFNRRPNRSWYAQRGIHQKHYSKYIGLSENITIARLEYVAAYFQSYLTIR